MSPPLGRLHQAAFALVAAAKVRDYLLSPAHPKNGGKAGFFGAFGFTAKDWPLLQQALARHPVRNDVWGVDPAPYGRKFVVRCQLETPDGRNPCITTIWIADDDDAPPRLVTAYP